MTYKRYCEFSMFGDNYCVFFIGSASTTNLVEFLFARLEIQQCPQRSAMSWWQDTTCMSRPSTTQQLLVEKNVCGWHQLHTILKAWWTTLSTACWMSGRPTAWLSPQRSVPKLARCATSRWSRMPSRPSTPSVNGPTAPMPLYSPFWAWLNQPQTLSAPLHIYSSLLYPQFSWKRHKATCWISNMARLATLKEIWPCLHASICQSKLLPSKQTSANNSLCITHKVLHKHMSA